MIGFAAHYLYQGTGNLLKDHTLFLEESGQIIDVRPMTQETASTLFFNGLILGAYRPLNEVDFLSMEEALKWLHEQQVNNPTYTVMECLEQFALVPGLIPGETTAVWCLEALDYRSFKLKDDTCLKTIYP